MAPQPSYIRSFDYINNDISQVFPRDTARSDNAPTLRSPLVVRADSNNYINPKYHPGLGAKDPNTFNNKGFFALFALIGAAMVVASIWFFFWAKNGGFVWRQGDWDDYKSTVLRRKGPDGKTLSGATKSTNLGQKSIAGTFDNDRREEMAQVRGYNFANPNEKQRSGNDRPGKNKRREPSDEDLRNYRHERPARVGGLNRELDGSQFDFANTDRSDVSSENSLRPINNRNEPEVKRKTFAERKREKKQERRKKDRDETRAPSNPQHRQSFPAYDKPSPDGSPTRHGSGYPEYPRRPDMAHAARHESPLRHSSPRQASGGLPTRSPRATPRSHRQSQPKPPGSWDAYSDVSSDTGTKSYEHHIPGLSRGGVAGGRPEGFRRGYGGHRDSLYDSEGDIGTTRF